MYIGMLPNGYQVFESDLGNGSLYGLHDRYHRIIRIGRHLRDRVKKFKVFIHECVHYEEDDEYRTRDKTRVRLNELGYDGDVL